MRDKGTGDYHLFYAVNDVTGLEEGNPGTSIVVDRLTGFDRLAGTPSPVVVPTLPQEVYELNRFGDGRDWHTIEGAAYVEHHDTAYLMYSANRYTGEDYHLGYASASLDRPVGELQWRKQPGEFDWAPLVRRSDAVEGTGHNTITKAPNLVDDWIVYHGRNTSEPRIPDAEQRTMRIDPLFYDGPTLRTPAPSSTAQTAPFRATLQTRLDEGPQHPGWRTVEGDTVPEAGRATWVTDPEAARTLIVADPLLASYRAEIALAGRVEHVGARYGVLVAYTDPQNYTEILLDAGSRSLIARTFRHNIGQVLATADLGTIDLRAIHTFGVERTFTRLEALLDDCRRLAVTLEPAPAQVGVVSYRTAAQTAHFAVTDHLSLFGDRLGLIGRLWSSSQPILTGPYGVGTPLHRAVELSSDGGRDERSYVHELERHGATATVCLRPVVHSTDTYAEVAVDGDGTVVRSVVDGQVTAEFRQASPAPRFSVRTVVCRGSLLITVAGSTVQLELPHRPLFRQHLRLTGATLRSLEQTALTQ